MVNLDELYRNLEGKEQEIAVVYARDERLAGTPIGRLIFERHEIEEKILDELDDQNGK